MKPALRISRSVIVRALCAEVDTGSAAQSAEYKNESKCRSNVIRMASNEYAMSQIINLRQVRRKKEKAERDAQAEQNRVLFGRTKSERQRDDAIKAKAKKLLDQHRLDKEGSE